MALNVSVGQVTYYVPSPAKGKQAERSKDDQLRARAAWAIPAALHKVATHLDGSNWYFNTSFFEEVKRVTDDFDAKAGIKFYLVEEFTSKDPTVVERIVRDSLKATVNAIAPSLKESVEGLIKKFDDMNLDDADGKIVDIMRENRAKLVNAIAVIASFGLTGDYRDVQEATAALLEAEMVRARTILGEKLLEARAKMETRIKAGGVA
jgi:hypothetical protein